MKNHTCQSCGMPLWEQKMCGTDKSGIRIEDYCVYCYKDGEFTEDVTMDEMIRLCARYVEGHSRNVAIVGMKRQYPHLKRWARKEQTQHEYHKSIIRVMEYIQVHLGENTDLKTLAGIANISPFHFHRIFKTTIGESLAEYVLRLRMEYVAEQLESSSFSLVELAEQTGYSSEQALSRTFKRYFGLPPKVFKASFLEEKFRDELVPRVCRVTEKFVITLKNCEETAKDWQKLYAYAMFKKLLSESTESLEIVNEGKNIPCLTTQSLVPSDKFVRSMILKEGLYAIFTHKGSYAGIDELYRMIMGHWLILSKYKLSQSFSYIAFLNNPSYMAEEDLITEIYIPVDKK